MHAVERFCDRAMLLERGDVVELGEPRTVAREYNELNFGRLVHEPAAADQGGQDIGSHAAQITDAWFERAGGRTRHVAQGERVTAAVAVRFHHVTEHPIVGITLRNEMGHTYFVATTEWQGIDVGVRNTGDEIVVRFSFDTPFATSQYLLTPSIARAGSGADALDVREDMTSLYVHATQFTGGLVELPYDVEIDES
jgi:hypothetical protein